MRRTDGRFALLGLVAVLLVLGTTAHASDGGTDPGPPASAAVSPEPDPRLEVHVTAEARYRRTWTWSVAVDGAEASAEVAAGPASFTSTITLDAGPGHVDGATLSGTITAVNPGRQPVADVVLSVAGDADERCRVDDATGLSVAPGERVERAYVCDVAGPDATAIVGVATWPTLAEGDPLRARDRVAVDWVEKRVDDCVRVEDDRDQGFAGERCVGDPPRMDARPVVSGDAGTCVTRKERVRIITLDRAIAATAERPLTVCTGADLSVRIAGQAQAERTWRWALVATPVTPRLEVWPGDLAASTIEVTVAAEPVDARWRVRGTVTVGNPSDWQALTVEPTPTIDGGECHLIGDADLRVAAGDQAVAAYGCELETAPGPGSVVTVAVRVAAGRVPSTQVTATATVELGAPASERDRCADLAVSHVRATEAPDRRCVTDSLPETVDVVVPAGGTPGTCVPSTEEATLTTDDSRTSVAVPVTTEVCVVAPLVVTLDATPGFTRTHTWALATIVEPPLVRPGERIAVVRYLGTATQTGVVDRGWRLDGFATLHNPNGSLALTVDLAARTDDGGRCALGDAAGLDIPPRGTVTLPVICRYTAAPTRPTGQLEVVATPRPPAGTPEDKPEAAPDGVTSTRLHAWTTPTTIIGATVTVTDTFEGVTWTLGRLRAAASAPFTVARNAYARTVTVPRAGCEAYGSVARIVETGTGEPLTVRVCATDATSR